MTKTIFVSILLVCLAACFFNSCQTYQTEAKLDPESRDFYSIARYLMTAKEKNRFFKLSPGEMETFIKEFWKRRDPIPETEENEFKELYFARIEQAKALFRRGPANELTDRGMIYVLFGPPDNMYSTEEYITSRGRNYQMWYYSFLFDQYPDVRVYFINRWGAGSQKYELVRDGTVFSMIQNAKWYYLRPRSEEKFFQYDIDLKKLSKTDDQVELLIQIKTPYQNIWFSEAAGKMETTLSLNMKILDTSKNTIWEHKQDYFISVFEKDVEELFKEKHIIEVKATLSKGKYSLHVSLTNTSGGGEEKKEMPLKI
jgi:GWxTD domain-containing protein